MSFLQKVKQFFTRKAFSRDEDVDRLIEEACEQGRMAGLHNVPDETAFSPVVSRLLAVATKRFQLPAPAADAVNNLLLTRGTERARLEQKARHTFDRSIPTPNRPAEVSVRTPKAFLNSLALFAVVALALQTIGYQLTWQGLMGLGICALIVAFNWVSVRCFLLMLPARTARLARLAARQLALGRSRRQIARLDREQAQMLRAVAIGTLRQAQAEEWISVMKPLLLSHFECERAKAERAVSIYHKRQQVGSLKEVDSLKEIDSLSIALSERPVYNGNPRSQSASGAAD